MALTVCPVEKIKTRILKVGKVNKVSFESGFTLMELIAVLFVLSIMFAFVVPEFSRKMIRNDAETTLNWIVFNASKLKKEARNQGNDLFMCINPAENLILIKKNSSDPEITEMDILDQFSVPEDLSLDRVEFNRPDQEGDNDFCIQFYKKGYSDHAIIHISDNDGNFFSCLIQPFLHKVNVYNEDVQFE
jgi:prepilin-type N-terminal cleavage/methylation domain-containing protein